MTAYKTIVATRMTPSGPVDERLEFVDHDPEDVLLAPHLRASMVLKPVRGGVEGTMRLDGLIALRVEGQPDSEETR